MTGESRSHDSGTGRPQRSATQRGSDVRESNTSHPGPNDGGQASGREGLFREGLDHYQNGEYTRAIRAWEILLEEFPGDRAAQRYLEEARNQLQLQEMAAIDGDGSVLLDQIFNAPIPTPTPFPQAEPEPQDDESSADVLFRKGESFYHQGRYREAREQFEAVLIAAPSHPDAYFLLELCKAREADQKEILDVEMVAQRLFDDGDYEGSMREWARVMESQPKNERAREMHESAKNAMLSGATVASKGGLAAARAAAAATAAGKAPAERMSRAKLVGRGGSSTRAPAVPGTKLGLEHNEADPNEPREGVPTTLPRPVAGPVAASTVAPEATVKVRAPVMAAGMLKAAGRKAPSDGKSPAPAPDALDDPFSAPSAAPAEPLDEATAKRLMREYFDAASKAERDSEHDRALDLYRRILSIAPDNDIAQERSSALEMMLQSRKFKQAFDALSRAKALSAKEPSLALAEVKRALQLRPELEEAQKLQEQLQNLILHKRWSGTMTRVAPWLAGVTVILVAVLWLVFGVILPQVQEHRVTGTLNAARRLLQQGKYAEAEDKLHEARAMAPQSQEVQRVYGRLLLAKGEYDDAVKVLRGLGRDGIGNPQDRYLLASALSKAGRLGDAEEILRDLVKEDPGFHAARREFAWLMIRQNKLAAASEQSNKLLAAQPEEPENAALAAAIFERMGMLTEALEQYEKAFQLGMRQPDQVSAHLDLLLKTNRLDEAQTLLSEARGAFPNDVEYRLREAMIAKRRGKLEQAEEAFQTALMMEPRNELAARELAAVLLAEKKAPAAEKVLSSFIERTGKSAAILAMLGDVYMALDNPVQAADSYREAQQMDASLPDISKRLERAQKAKKPR